MKHVYKYLIGTLIATLIVAVSASAATIFTPSQGGTGTGTKPTAGKVLIGTSGSIYTPAYLTAGSNITITTSSGGITIAAAASGSGSTTTINSVNGPTFTFNVSTNSSSGLSYATSSGTVTLTQTTSTDSLNGFISAADHATFNGKQAAGNYITALTGDVSASGPGSVAATLATVNSTIGTFGSSSLIPIFTVNGKGLITAASTSTIAAPASALTGTTLASGVTASSLTSVGTIGTGVWNGTAIGSQYGGTGINTSASTGFFKVAGGTWSVESTSTHRTSLGLGTGDSPTFSSSTFSNLTAGSVLLAGTSGALAQDNSNFFWDATNHKLGLGSASPSSTLFLSNTADPLSGVSTWTNYPFIMQSAIATNSSSTGICFVISSTADNCGGSIIFKRTGSASQGELQFYTKNSTSNGVVPVQRMTINNAGNIGIASSTPITTLSIQSTSSPAIASVGQYYTQTDAVTANTSSTTVNWNLGNVKDITMSTSTTFTLTNPQDGGRYLLELRQDATGSRTPTFPAAVLWSGGTTPTWTTTASKVDMVSCVYRSSVAKYYCSSSLNF